MERKNFIYQKTSWRKTLMKIWYEVRIKYCWKCIDGVNLATVKLELNTKRNRVEALKDSIDTIKLLECIQKKRIR